MNTMGASWFVSYSYFDHIDINHLAWQAVPKTCPTRMDAYRFTTPLHRYWLHKVLGMTDWCLKKNKLGLHPQKVKEMAWALLALPEGKTRVYPCVRNHVLFWKHQYEFLLKFGTAEEVIMAENALAELDDVIKQVCA